MYNYCYCKGCTTHEKKDDSCGGSIASKVNLKGDCPCTNCLVKPTCRHGCNDYTKFHSYIVTYKGLKMSPIINKG